MEPWWVSGRRWENKGRRQFLYVDDILYLSLPLICDLLHLHVLLLWHLSDRQIVTKSRNSMMDGWARKCCGLQTSLSPASRACPGAAVCDTPTQGTKCAVRSDRRRAGHRTQREQCVQVGRTTGGHATWGTARRRGTRNGEWEDEADTASTPRLRHTGLHLTRWPTPVWEQVFILPEKEKECRGVK